jgi:hypothetical protein
VISWSPGAVDIALESNATPHKLGFTALPMFISKQKILIYACDMEKSKQKDNST